MTKHFRIVSALFLGILLGGGVLAVAQVNSAQRTGLTSAPVTQLFFSSNKEGLRVNNTNTVLVDESTKLIDLPPFVEAESQENGRYQALNLGDGRDFMVLDTRTGLVNAYYESGKVQVFNSLVPNHLLEAPVKRHKLGEELR